MSKSKVMDARPRLAVVKYGSGWGIEEFAANDEPTMRVDLMPERDAPHPEGELHPDGPVRVPAGFNTFDAALAAAERWARTHPGVVVHNTEPI